MSDKNAVQPGNPTIAGLALLNALKEADLDHVDALEKRCFDSPWPRDAYARELHNPFSFYKAIRSTEAGKTAGLAPILAYGGCHVLGEDAHIMTVAAHPDYRRCGLAEWIMLALLTDAVERAAAAVHLEARESNRAAIGLYEKLGFEQVGLRRNYYPATRTSPREDAILMTSFNPGPSERLYEQRDAAARRAQMKLQHATAREKR